jgi:hypothetical protein
MTLPQLSSELFLADGGLETTLVFHDGIELVDFAAFPLLDSDWGASVAGALLHAVSGSGAILWHRDCARHPDVAGQSRLGCAARLRPTQLRRIT